MLKPNSWRWPRPTIPLHQRGAALSAADLENATVVVRDSVLANHATKAGCLPALDGQYRIRRWRWLARVWRSVGCPPFGEQLDAGQLLPLPLSSGARLLPMLYLVVADETGAGPAAAGAGRRPAHPSERFLPSTSG